MPKMLFQKIPKEDKGLFTSSTVLLHYWIVKRHNPECVTKQFGIKQDVPPPFYLPFTRVERLERFEKNYQKYGDEVIGLWEARQRNVLTGQKGSSKIHSPSYHAWYSSNTIKEIVCGVGGRGRQLLDDTQMATPKAEVEIKEQPKPMGSTHCEETSTTEKHVSFVSDLLYISL